MSHALLKNISLIQIVTLGWRKLGRAHDETYDHRQDAERPSHGGPASLQLHPLVQDSLCILVHFKMTLVFSSTKW